MHRNSTPSTLARGSVIAWFLLSLAITGCSNGWNPLDPVDTPDGQPPLGGPPHGGPPPAGPEPPDEPSPSAPPAPSGTLEIVVTGHEEVNYRGYRVIVQIEGEAEPRTRFATGASVRISELPPGTHAFRVEPFTETCAARDPGDHLVTIIAGETSTFEVAVTCSPTFGFLAGTYERVTPSFPQFVSERYEIQADGTFRLVYQRSATDSFAYPGVVVPAHSPTETGLVLLFADNSGRWAAAATLRGNCIDVVYNDDMWLSDFAHGEYCR